MLGIGSSDMLLMPCRAERILRHPLHEEGLQRQIGVGTLVSSQERKPLFVSLVKRWSTADFVPPSVLSTN